MPAPSPARPRALVTGALSGIGLTFAERLAAQGHDLVLVARAATASSSWRLGSGAMRASGPTCLSQTSPIRTNWQRLRRGRRATNCSSCSSAMPASAAIVRSLRSTQVIDDLIGVHLRAVARLTRAALPGMIRRGSGAIVNVASLLALSGPLAPDPLPHRATYAGAKAFMLTFAQALAGELKGAGVRVQVCLPGRVNTEFHTIQGMDVSALPPAMTADGW